MNAPHLYLITCEYQSMRQESVLCKNDNAFDDFPVKK